MLEILCFLNKLFKEKYCYDIIRISYICKFSNISKLLKWFCIGFDNQNRKQNISGTAYRSDLCLRAKRMGGHPSTAHIKHRTLALIGTEI